MRTPRARDGEAPGRNFGEEEQRRNLGMCNQTTRAPSRVVLSHKQPNNACSFACTAALPCLQMLLMQRDRGSTPAAAAASGSSSLPDGLGTTFGSGMGIGR